MKKTPLIILILLINVILLSQWIINVYSKESDKSDLNALFQRGVNLYVKRDFDEACKLNKEVLSLDSYYRNAGLVFESSFKLYNEQRKNYYLAKKKIHDEWYQESLVNINKALHISPRFKKGLELRDELLNRINARIEIVDKLSETAKKINEVDLFKGDEISLFAVVYDGDDNYMGSIDVKWENTETLDDIQLISHLEPLNKNITKLASIEEDPIKTSYEAVFIPSTLNTKGLIVITIEGTDLESSTGNITVE